MRRPTTQPKRRDLIEDEMEPVTLLEVLEGCFRLFLNTTLLLMSTLATGYTGRFAANSMNDSIERREFYRRQSGDGSPKESAKFGQENVAKCTAGAYLVILLFHFVMVAAGQFRLSFRLCVVASFGVVAALEFALVVSIWLGAGLEEALANVQ